MGDSTQHTSPEQAGDQLHRRGLMFILSSPSGAGKTTLSRMLLAKDSEIKLSVSATTRPPRPGEVDGVHYHFVSPERFQAMIDEDDFYEWAEVFGHRYGTPKGIIRAALKHTHGRRIDAATRLGLGRNTITRKIQDLGLED